MSRRRPTEDEVKRIIELCWRAAGEADLGDIPRGVIEGRNANGPVLDLVRWTTYQKLLDNLIPKTVDTTFTNADAKQPWQRDPDDDDDDEDGR